MDKEWTGELIAPVMFDPAQNQWTPTDLDAARPMPLGLLPVTAGAVALVEGLTTAVGAAEDRKRRRGVDGVDKLRRAVGAVTGSLLLNWGRKPARASSRPLNKHDFAGELVWIDQWSAAVDGMLTLGFLRRSPAITFVARGTNGPRPFQREAAVLFPTDRLTALAAHHGVLPANVTSAFVEACSTTPPVIREPIILKSLSSPRRAGSQKPAKDILPIPEADRALADALRADVVEANGFAAGFTVEGCKPPRWARTFSGSLQLQGRWYSRGERHVQSMRQAERLGVTINGQPVVELDISASFLTILQGLAGQPASGGDPYQFDGLPRHVVKAWIVATIGKGSPVTKWSDTEGAEDAKVVAPDPREVGRPILARYPFLRSPAACIPGLDAMATLGKPPALVVHRLTAVEAEAMTAAMRNLRAQGILALPVHDSLIVPQTAEDAARVALTEAFMRSAGATIRLVVKRPDPAA